VTPITEFWVSPTKKALLQRPLKTPPQSQSPPQPSGIVTTVTDNLMLRRGPNPLSPSVLEGLYPDYIPAGQHFSFENFSQASHFSLQAQP
jgi:hypothetical protein